MPAVQDARAAFGSRLRELRRAAGLTGAQLADQLSWPTSKISKLENARQTPSEVDVREWAAATGADDATEALLASLQSLEQQHGEWRRMLRGGLRVHQESITDLVSRAHMLRVFEPVLVPGLFQTPAYARSRFTDGASYIDTPVADADEAVRERMSRQELLYRADKRYHVVLSEATLRYRMCPPEVMLGQLDRLLTLAGLPTVRLGIIGFDTSCVAPLHGFWMFDDARVTVETYSAVLTLAQKAEIDIYRRAFDRLASAASYGREARSLITRVVDDLSSEDADFGHD